MHLQNGYGVTDLTPRQLLLPPDNPSLPANFPIPPPPPPPPNLDSSQQFPPHQFQLFWQHDQETQPQQQQQTPPVVVDPNFPLNFRAGMDAGNSSPHNLIGLVGGGGFTSYRPPPSVDVAPQPLRWINQEDPLWKCVHKSEPQISAMDAQFRDQFGGAGASSKPEIDNHYSQSPGSVSEIYESTQWPSHDNGLEGGVVKEKKKKKHKCCKEEEEKLERELKLMARFVEGQLMAHQDRLQRRFTASIERMERERREREESWRAADAETARVHATARAREQALASSREAVIVSYLERISGLKIGADRCEGRWPGVEVEALIGARSALETRFREPGPKAGLWEEVSGVMEGMGFRRSAKRCKEKWENINKYFRKAKDDANDDGSEGRRPGKRSKVCSYFDQLDQHYNSRAQAMSVDRMEDAADDGNGHDSTPPDSSSYNKEDDNGENADGERKSLGDQLEEDNKG